MFIFLGRVFGALRLQGDFFFFLLFGMEGILGKVLTCKSL